MKLAKIIIMPFVFVVAAFIMVGIAIAGIALIVGFVFVIPAYSIEMITKGEYLYLIVLLIWLWAAGIAVKLHLKN